MKFSALLFLLVVPFSLLAQQKDTAKYRYSADGKIIMDASNRKYYPQAADDKMIAREREKTINSILFIIDNKLYRADSLGMSMYHRFQKNKTTMIENPYPSSEVKKIYIINTEK